METWTMSSAKTLMQLAGIDLTPPRLGDACLVLIDIQNEYLAGPLALPDASPAIARATALLGRARESGAKIIHIAHKGAPGSLFDRDAERGLEEGLAQHDGLGVLELDEEDLRRDAVAAAGAERAAPAGEEVAERRVEHVDLGGTRALRRRFNVSGLSRASTPCVPFAPNR